ncbi:TetR/AcrR family transcriptional regulator [Solimonas terrae]|uniref:TetR/AcrR family transcriptional regulator n=1 Tax=Solimonas terrae TaxID=1396819 RepID=A0A6M2BN81_9GAMM|nr:TetR/AcrR family transcriptional regulator [Solimonas terrae]NGY04112.1 TetR/AcrR family transcriptional regulator [Solimonas terrae]
MTTMTTKVRKLRLNRSEQRQSRTSELLDAAWELFCERGYDAITIDQVAEFAGYSRKPVYTLFGDKQTLFFELWARMFLELIDSVQVVFEPGATLRANLKRTADLGAERGRQGAILQDRGLFFVVQTIALGREDLAARAKKMHETVLDQLAAAIKASRLEGKDRLRGKPEEIAAHLIAHINGLSLLHFQTGKNYMKADDLLDLFVCMSITSKPAR